jgi:hypothetical protein
MTADKNVSITVILTPEQELILAAKLQAEQERMAKKLAKRESMFRTLLSEGKPLTTVGAARGRKPAGVSDNDLTKWVTLRTQLDELKLQRSICRTKMDQIKEQLTALRGAAVASKPRKVKPSTKNTK